MNLSLSENKVKEEEGRERKWAITAPLPPVTQFSLLHKPTGRDDDDNATKVMAIPNQKPCLTVIVRPHLRKTERQKVIDAGWL